MADRRATRVGRQLAVVAALLVLGVVALMVFQRSLIFFPDAGRLPPAATVLSGGRDVTTTTADGLELTSWYVPAPAGCAATVLVAHGNGGNLAGRADLARAIVDRGFGVLLLGYRGYGGNPTSPAGQRQAPHERRAPASSRGGGGAAPGPRP